ncbi:MAG: nucleoside:proton symporter [Rhodospirillaceae bacterium]|nr:nucleoside:proton symporter [Rhodospirillaceae bacterium]MBT5512688.1 nucleoside:proton symporter [Rhodospirillaceae bacterium]MBT6086848.1 nucleoside:proton symporter [Rhodospirillaceae bacterium]MBT6608881.1 nucleoside:proton symporter [Rhodospirillaceae bacterium]
MELMQSLLGITALTVLAIAFSERRAALRGRALWHLVGAGLGLQFAIALLLLKVPVAKALFLGLNDVVLALQQATRAGTRFVFGYIGGGTLPFTESYPGAAFVLGFQALPLILVVSALSALLYHWRILPAVVRAFAWLLGRIFRLGGAAGVGVAANVFVGMVEAPLLIRPYLQRLGRSDLFVVMTAGMATIAGTMMVIYATILEPVIPGALGHILTASLINAPAAIVIARLMVPPEPTDDAPINDTVELPRTAGGAMDTITQGTVDGVKLLINVIAMLIVMIALVSLVNIVLGLAPDVAGQALTLQRLLGWALAPLAWLLGIPWEQAATAGGLLGAKIILNEFIAYAEMAKLPAEMLNDRARLIMTYALCGFANFGSLGIMIGGLTTMAPERRADIVSLGMKSIAAGVMATCMTAAVVAVLI